MYSVVSITVERYTTLRNLNKVVILDLKLSKRLFYFQPLLKGKYIFLLIISFSVCYNIVKFFELTVDEVVSKFIDVSCFKSTLFRTFLLETKSMGQLFRLKTFSIYLLEGLIYVSGACLHDFSDLA